MRKIFAAILLLAICSAPVSAQKNWEEMEREIAVAERMDGEMLEITVKDGYVYVTTSRPVTVKIFSILGQLISQKTIPAGTWRTHIASRGIYILKAGTQTKRITI
ncbi:MAG: T9SS type A sorting domain-containing protein [Bacteroidales bacterium]|nr:T9SS type A sorting domain-containing protein [Bacteroidales bacterium]MDE6802804.1 T9SS type A sorting domain-containing protein [Muribaculaceae bacterium]MDE6832084.1 T9SS type A sorting domain-containing protein [Muribaculaceae bacterium]